MSKLSLPAARVRQGALTLYATSLKVKNLLAKNFIALRTLDPENDADGGFQRLLNRARAKKLADYILKGKDSERCILADFNLPRYRQVSTF